MSVSTRFSRSRLVTDRFRNAWTMRLLPVMAVKAR